MNSLNFNCSRKTVDFWRVNFSNFHFVGSFIFSGYEWECSIFGNLETKSNDIGERVLLIYWFYIVYCAVFCAGFYCQWTIFFPSKTWIWSGEVQLYWTWPKLVKMTRYDDHGWTWMKRIFRCVWKHCSLQTWPCHETNSHSPSLIFRSPNSHDKQRYWTTVPQKSMGKNFTVSANGTLMSEKQNTGTQFPSVGFELRVFRSLKRKRTATCIEGKRGYSVREKSLESL